MQAKGRCRQYRVSATLDGGRRNKTRKCNNYDVGIDRPTARLFLFSRSTATTESRRRSQPSKKLPTRRSKTTSDASSLSRASAAIQLYGESIIHTTMFKRIFFKSEWNGGSRVDRHTALSSPSWQEKVISAVSSGAHRGGGVGGVGNDDATALDSLPRRERSTYHPFVDNASFLFCGSTVAAGDAFGGGLLLAGGGGGGGAASASTASACAVGTDDTSVARILLRWSKIVVLKLARTYYALPIFMFVLPLSLGLLGGYWLGRRRAVSSKKAARVDEQRSSDDNSTRGRWGEEVVSLLSTFGSWLVSSFRGNAGGEVQVEGVLKIEPTGKQRQSQQTPQPRLLTFPESRETMLQREAETRGDLSGSRDALRESGVDEEYLPKHVAVVMDGNRRYGKKVYGKGTHGHWDGSRKLVEFAKWCLAERIQVLTVYAFSTENWKRDPEEIDSLMRLFATYCDELREEGVKRNIRVRVLSTERSRLPSYVKTGLDRLQNDTAGCRGGLDMNICLSYGSRSEIVQACQHLAREYAFANSATKPTKGILKKRTKDVTKFVNEQSLSNALLTGGENGCPDPDIMIRTSGEERLSNFLLWQLAYTELFFVDKHWPEIEKVDLLRIIRSYANGRRRRFGK